jgi:hypothetical protein
VLVGGGMPPLAVVSVPGQGLYQVGLNASLPGNARVKAIRADYVTLSVGGHDLRLDLKK